MSRTNNTSIGVIMHPSIKHVMQYFKYDHLPPHLREVSKKFSDLADQVCELSESPEVTIALRKLLEAKDAAVRAAIKED